MKNLVFALLLLASLSVKATQPTFKNVATFASVEKSRQLLLTEDLFTNSWSQFDIDARMQQRNSTKSALFEYISQQVLEWSLEDKEKVSQVIDEIDAAIKAQKFNINLPNEILLVKTTALEEGGASGYTRQNYIVINHELLKGPDNLLKQLIIHELFHIISRTDADFRADMYKIIGFNITNSIAYPPTLKDYRITNPDAPQTDAFITVLKNNKPVQCMMVLYSDQPYNGGMLFKYLNVGFMELVNSGEHQPLVMNGKPVIHSMNEITEFFEQIGRNTQYILHPEEIMADNFVYAINNRKKQPSQKIIDAIQKRLRKR